MADTITITLDSKEKVQALSKLKLSEEENKKLEIYTLVEEKAVLQDQLSVINERLNELRGK